MGIQNLAYRSVSFFILNGKKRLKILLRPAKAARMEGSREGSGLACSDWPFSIFSY